MTWLSGGSCYALTTIPGIIIFKRSEERFLFVERYNDPAVQQGLTDFYRSYKFTEIDIKDKTCLERFTYHSRLRAPGNIENIRVTADGRKAFIFGDNYGITVLDMENGDVIRHFGNSNNAYGAITRDGLHAFSNGYGDNGKEFIRMWDAETGGSLRITPLVSDRRQGPRCNAGAIEISPDGKWLAVGTGTTADVFLLSTRDLSIARVYRHDMATTINNVAFSPLTPHLATYAKGVLKVWELPD